MKQPTAVICLSKNHGGMELAAVKIAKLLSEDMPIIFLTRKNGYIAKMHQVLFENSDVKLFETSSKRHFSFMMIMQIRKIIQQFGICNVIFLGTSEIKSLYFAFLGLNINLIVRQGTVKSSSKKDLLHKLFYSNVATFVGNSDYMVENIKKIFPIPNHAEVKRIYASVELHDITSHPYARPLKIICVGRIARGKGQMEAINACHGLVNSGIDFELLLLGGVEDQSYKHEIDLYMDNIDYRASIKFLGHDNNVLPYYRDSDIFLFPTKGEGMSNAVIEALGYGLSTLSYENTSLPEFQKLGFHIHLVKDQDVEALATKLTFIASDIATEKRACEKNILKARDEFSQAREKNEYRSLLV